MKKYIIVGALSANDKSVVVFNRENGNIDVLPIEFGVREGLLENWDSDKNSPHGGWDRYTVFVAGGAPTNAKLTFIGTSPDGGGYQFVDSCGNISTEYSYLSLMMQDTDGRAFSNWFGVHENCVPITYAESANNGEKAVYNAFGAMLGSTKKPAKTRVKSEKTATKGENSKKERVKYATDLEQERILKYFEWKDLLEDGDELLQEKMDELDANSTLCAQFRVRGYSSKHNVVAVRGDDNTVRFGIVHDYGSERTLKDGSGDVSRYGIILEPIYKLLRVVHSPYTGHRLVFALTEDDYIEITDLKTGNRLSEYSGIYRLGATVKFKLKDYIMLFIGTTKAYLLVGAEVPGKNNSQFWCAVDLKELKIVKTVSQMKPYGALCKDNRVVRARGLQVVDFETDNGEYLALYLKDYSYETRLMLGRNSLTLANRGEEDEIIPSWTILHFDLTSGEIAYSNNLKKDTKVVIKRFTNLKQETVGMVAKLLGCGFTRPDTKDVKVRRHIERHILCSTDPITDYSKVKQLLEHLTSFETDTNIYVWSALLIYSGVNTLDGAYALFDSSNFTQILETNDTPSISGMLYLLTISNTGGVFIGAFKRGNSDIQLYLESFNLGSNSKSSFVGEEAEGLKQLIKTQESNMQFNTVTILGSEQRGGVQVIPVAPPATIVDKYGNSATKLCNVTTNLRVTQLLVEIGGKYHMHLFIALNDGLSFRYLKDQLEQRQDDTVYAELSATDELPIEYSSNTFSTAVRASVYTKIMNPNKPVLETNLLSVFKVTIA